MAVTQPIDTNSHAGALQQNIQFIFSKYDNDLRRQKTIDGMREKLLRGEWIGHAPTGYSFVKGAETQTIVINERGELIKQAFIWRSNGMTYPQILGKLKHRGLNLIKQSLSRIFRNPFYCGFMTHNLLRGEIVRGTFNLIDEDLFFKANELTKIDGFKVNKANENLPLKVFVKDAESGAPFTGYLAKKKGLYYYKANKVGVKVNRSVNIMHCKFRELLQHYTIDSSHIEPLQVQLHYTWENLVETSTSEKKSLSLKLNSIEEEFYNLRKNHAIGKLNMDVYEEFSQKMIKDKEVVLEQIEKLEQELSNPKEFFYDTCKLASKLSSIWDSGDYYQKQMFQYTLFPNGLVYDSKIEDYRTPALNEVIRHISELSIGLRDIRDGTSRKTIEKSPSVPEARLELAHHYWRHPLKVVRLPISPSGLL